MKLIKTKDVEISKNFYVIEDVSDKVYWRTIRENNIKECIKGIYNHQVRDIKFNLEDGEELIFEIEFEKLEDLIELIPEEFL